MAHKEAKFNPTEPIDTEKRHTFITLVKYHPNKGLEDLEDYLNLKMVKAEFKDKIKVNLVAVTFGVYDSVIIWQAEDMEDAKKFRDNPSTSIGDFSTMIAMRSDGWRKT